MHLKERIRAALASHERTSLPPGPRPAAVLLLLFERGGSYHVLYTKRTEELQHHGGEISFPGGVHQNGDPSLLHTALRETYEEVGIPPEQVEVLGELDDICSVHDYLVTPYVGIFPGSCPLIVNEAEIAKVVTIPLPHLLDPENFRTEEWAWRGENHTVYFYSFGEDEVWGLTSAITKQFLDIVFPTDGRAHATRHPSAPRSMEEPCMAAS